MSFYGVLPRPDGVSLSARNVRVPMVSACGGNRYTYLPQRGAALRKTVWDFPYLWGVRSAVKPMGRDSCEGNAVNARIAA